MTFSPFETKNLGNQDCSDKQVTGSNSNIYSYIAKLDNDDTIEDNIQPPPCPKRKHTTAQIDSLQVNTSIIGAGSINIDGNLTAGGAKAFDIPHPTKEGHRLRHICLEGPEAGVYIRGTLKGTTITVPEYWKGLVDEESISVHLTPIGSGQNLYVESIEWGRRVEYEGTSIEDYPGDNSQYSHNK